METVPVLMLRGHAINMSWKTQLYFSRCWNYTMYSGTLTMYPIFKLVFGMVSVRQNSFTISVQVHYCMLSYVPSKKIGFTIHTVNISLASKIYRAPAAIDQENFILFPPHSPAVHEQVILMVLWVLLLPRGKFGNKGRRKTMGSPWIRIRFIFFEREKSLYQQFTFRKIIKKQ